MTLEARAEIRAAIFDPEQLGRALDNLIRNALQAAPPGSRVTVSAGRRNGELVFAVRDAGPGPPLDLRDSLFEPFVTGRPDGTGLGLSIVREIAAAHDGSARLGNADTGTVFEIVLPCPSC